MELDQWLAAVAAEVGTSDLVLSPDEVRTLLDLARDAAHEVERVAAPLTTFLVGVAVGRGAPLADVARQVTTLALRVGDDPAAGRPPAGAAGGAATAG